VRCSTTEIGAASDPERSSSARSRLEGGQARDLEPVENTPLIVAS